MTEEQLEAIEQLKTNDLETKDQVWDGITHLRRYSMFKEEPIEYPVLKRTHHHIFFKNQKISKVQFLLEVRSGFYEIKTGEIWITAKHAIFL